MLDTQKFGGNLARLRKNAGMTQSELADRLNLTRQAISRYELGESYPDISILALIADVFHITVDELTGAGEPARTEVLNLKSFDELGKIKAFLNNRKTVVLNLENFSDAILDYMRSESIITPENHRCVEKHDDGPFLLIMPPRQEPPQLDFIGIEVLNPKSIDEIKKIKDILREPKVVIINLDKYDDLFLVVLDYMRGESIIPAKNNVQKIDNKSLLITPANV